MQPETATSLDSFSGPPAHGATPVQAETTAARSPDREALKGARRPIGAVLVRSAPQEAAGHDGWRLREDARSALRDGRSSCSNRFSRKACGRSGVRTVRTGVRRMRCDAVIGRSASPGRRPAATAPPAKGCPGRRCFSAARGGGGLVLSLPWRRHRNSVEEAVRATGVLAGDPAPQRSWRSRWHRRDRGAKSHGSAMVSTPRIGSALRCFDWLRPTDARSVPGSYRDLYEARAVVLLRELAGHRIDAHAVVVRARVEPHCHIDGNAAGVRGVQAGD